VVSRHLRLPLGAFPLVIQRAPCWIGWSSLRIRRPMAGRTGRANWMDG